MEKSLVEEGIRKSKEGDARQCYIIRRICLERFKNALCILNGKGGWGSCLGFLGADWSP